MSADSLEVNSFAHGQAELIKLKITEGSMLDGISIQEFGKRGIANVLICMIERAGEVYIPWGDFVCRKVIFCHLWLTERP